MRKNTMSLADYILFSLIWTGIMYVWFNGVLYRHLPGMGTVRSHIVLFVILTGIFVVNLNISGGYARNRLSAAAVIVLSYGMYVAIANSKYMKRLYIAIAAAATAATVLLLINIFGRRIPACKNRRKVLRVRWRSAYLAIRNTAAAAMVFLLAYVYVTTNIFHGIAGASLVRPTGVYGDEYAMANNIDMFLLLQQDEWEKLNGDTGKKLDILQTVVNCEGRYLAYNEPVTVVAADLPSSVLAAYHHNDRTILVNMDTLDRPSEEVLSSILHECYHCAQHQYVEIYTSLASSDKSSFFMSDAAVYANEIANYEDGQENFHKYYSQRLEMDARAYSITGAEVIMSRIDEYLDRNNADEALLTVGLGSAEPPERSITGLCSREGELAARERTYDENGELCEYKEYEYDEYGRYSSVQRYGRNDEKRVLELIEREEYSYDDYFYYINYSRGSNLTGRRVFDLHGNGILSQLHSDSTGVSFDLTYNYKYPIDTKEIQEEYCYEGEQQEFLHHLIKRYNGSGDIVYRMIQDSDRMDIERDDYEYDEDGRILVRRTEYEHDACRRDIKSLARTEYSYNEEGQLLAEHEFVNEGIGTGYESNFERIITYEYDDRSRLIKKHSSGILASDYKADYESNHSYILGGEMNAYTVLYEY